jgi:hypothetical protein
MRTRFELADVVYRFYPEGLSKSEGSGYIITR